MTKRDVRVKAEKDFRRNYVAVIAERDALQAENARLRDDWRTAASNILDAVRESPDAAADTIEIIRKIIIGGAQAHFCAHCGELFPADAVAAHVQTCEKNPVVQENARLRAELTAARDALKIAGAMFGPVLNHADEPDAAHDA